jgi:hypothetical protein
MGRASGLVDKAIRAGLRRGVRNGLGDGSRVWLVLGAGAAGIRLVQWMARPPKSVIVTEVLEPGQTIVIQHFDRDR